MRATTKPAPTAKYIHTRAEACLDLRTTPLGSSRGLDAIHHFFTADEPEFCRQSLEYDYGGCRDDKLARKCETASPPASACEQ